MTRDDIIRMAREQGLPETATEGVFIVNADDLGRMLAAAEEIERLAARLEATEEDRARLLVEIGRLCAQCDALRAKVEAMERQEPVAWLHESRRDSDVVTDAVKHVWGKVAVGSMAAYSIPLYAIPGAQGEEKMDDLTKRLCRPGYDLQKEQAIQEAIIEIRELRAKIEEMEKQEPVGQFIQHPSNGLWEQDGYGDNPDARPLYALPGVKGEEK